MSKTFTVHVAKLGTFSLQEAAINKDLKSWFGRIAKYDREHKNRWKYSDVKVTWWYSAKTDAITVADTDVLVYVMRESDDSLIKKVMEANGKTAPVAEHAGLTMSNEPSVGKKVVSEAYAGCRAARYTAETIFHEAMHNKTGWGNKKLHGRGGIGGSDHSSVNKATVVKGKEREYKSAKESGMTHDEMLCRDIVKEWAEKDPLTNKNIQDMAAHLGVQRAQWSDGFKFLKEQKEKKKIKLDFDDPLSGL